MLKIIEKAVDKVVEEYVDKKFQEIFIEDKVIPGGRFEADRVQKNDRLKVIFEEITRLVVRERIQEAVKNYEVPIENIVKEYMEKSVKNMKISISTSTY